MEILLATNNHHKIQEMTAILANSPVKLQTPRALGIDLEISESGSSYQENARIKAEAFAHASGIPALADDSGLEVDALGGQPGIHSHRFGIPQTQNDHERCLYLLEQLKQSPQPWRARFHSCVVLANPNGQNLTAHGSCEGQIIPEFRGKNGFGYDPIFYISNLGQTIAELPDELKNQISHRARALQTLLRLLFLKN
ncbi:MAG: RdgB/HAM1 family non-canonical purine NTP pyrophosphatase [Anaerolineaceae bacterium]|jgi:XTP/dITP diphosphohydrolase